MLFQIFEVMAPVLLCAAIGFLWGRKELPFDTSTVTSVVTLVGVPCLVFDTLVRLGLDTAVFVRMGAAALAVLAAIAACVVLVRAIWRFSLPVVLPPLLFGNSGNLGLSLCLFAFGEQGLALAIAYFTALVLVQFTAGVAIASGKAFITDLLRIPIVYAVLGALPFMNGSVHLPKWILDTVHLLAGLSIPLMVLALGVSLARLRIRTFAGSAALSVARIALSFFLGVAVSHLFALSPLERAVVIVQSSMPVAVFNYLFALRYNREPELVAGAVLASSLAMFALLPALLWFVLPGTGALGPQ
jgi:predicted permease